MVNLTMVVFYGQFNLSSLVYSSFSFSLNTKGSADIEKNIQEKDLLKSLICEYIQLLLSHESVNYQIESCIQPVQGQS